MNNLKKDNNIKIDKHLKFGVFRIFLFLLLVSIIVLSLLTWLIFYLGRNQERANILEVESARLGLLDEYSRDFFASLSADLIFFKSHNELSEYLNNTNEDEDLGINALSQEFLKSFQAKSIYDQIRFIDEKGMEVLRVNYNNGRPAIVPKDELQFKGDRYCFKDISKLNEGEVFVSPLDLNIENSEIEKPIKPMIRLGTPIFDDKGERRGMILINFLAEDYLDKMENFYLFENVKLMLINKDGYFLKTDEKEREWGFMYGEDEKNNVFKNIYPEAWPTVSSNDKGFVFSVDGLYVFDSIYPLSSAQKSSTGSGRPFEPSLGEVDFNNYYWKVISFVPNQYLYKNSNNLLRKVIGIDIVFLVLVSFVLWFLARAVEKRRISEKRSMELSETLLVFNKILRHDLLNKFVGVVALLDTYNDEADKKLLELADESAKRGIDLIHDMKNLESLVAEGDYLRPIEVDSLLRETIKSYKIPIKIKGKAKVMADKILRSVFDNLISNAIRHGKTKKMEIVLKSNKKQVQILFKDFGKGIPKTIKEKLFEEGFKHGPTGNTGIGLYVVKKTIERYGGNIIIRDNKPKGAIFEINLNKGK